jgi:ABC-type Fe2+-enterobactin transport system substrate-binding protein
MNYAAMGQLLVKYGKLAGPKVGKAWVVVAPLLQKSPQARKMAEQFTAQMSKRRNGVQAQIDLAKQYAAEAMTEQTAPDRQEIARSWSQRAKVLEMALRTTENMPRKTAKPRRLEVAGSVDELLAEMIETMSKWGVGT